MINDLMIIISSKDRHSPQQQPRRPPATPFRPTDRPYGQHPQTDRWHSDGHWISLLVLQRGSCPTTIFGFAADQRSERDHGTKIILSLAIYPYS